MAEENDKNYAEFFAQLWDSKGKPKHKTGQQIVVGVLKPAWLEILKKHGIFPDSTAIVIRDSDIFHALRDTKKEKSLSLPFAVFAQLPRQLQKAQAVFLDATHAPPSLLFVNRVGDKVHKIVVPINYKIKKEN